VEWGQAGCRIQATKTSGGVAGALPLQLQRQPEAARGRREPPMVGWWLGAPTVHHRSRTLALKGSGGGGVDGAVRPDARQGRRRRRRSRRILAVMEEVGPLLLLDHDGAADQMHWPHILRGCCPQQRLISPGAACGSGSGGLGFVT
jgi:hypothetical protein